MKLVVENIAAVGRAEIAVDGISVLAGLDATGKSTVCRSLDAIVRAYSGILPRVRDARRRSVGRMVDGFLADVSEPGLFGPQENDGLVDGLLEGRLRLPESRARFLGSLPRTARSGPHEASGDAERLYEEFRARVQRAMDRPQEDYVKFLVEGSIRGSFDGQVNTLGRDTTGRIELRGDGGTPVCHAAFRGNRLSDCSTDAIGEDEPLYLGPRHVLDCLEAGTERAWDPLLDHLRPRGGGGRTIEDHEKEKLVAALIDGAIRGGLVEEEGSLRYVDGRTRMPVPMGNVASGAKTFAVLKRLAENGQFHGHRTLVVDGPENGLHPAWQVVLAETLVVLNKEFGLKVFLATHSPYFVRAVDACSRRYGVEGRCRFYRTAELEDGLYRTEDVTDGTERIFRDLYLPLEAI